jgi:hypothetical protein
VVRSAVPISGSLVTSEAVEVNCCWPWGIGIDPLGRVEDTGPALADARDLAKRGYFVMNLTYRSAEDWVYPAPVDDGGVALDWIEANAAQHGIDPRRLLRNCFWGEGC